MGVACGEALRARRTGCGPKASDPKVLVDLIVRANVAFSALEVDFQDVFRMYVIMRHNHQLRSHIPRSSIKAVGAILDHKGIPFLDGPTGDDVS